MSKHDKGCNEAPLSCVGRVRAHETPLSSSDPFHERTMELHLRRCQSPTALACTPRPPARSTPAAGSEPLAGAHECDAPGPGGRSSMGCVSANDANHGAVERTRSERSRRVAHAARLAELYTWRGTTFPSTVVLRHQRRMHQAKAPAKPQIRLFQRGNTEGLLQQHASC